MQPIALADVIRLLLCHSTSVEPNIELYLFVIFFWGVNFVDKIVA